MAGDAPRTAIVMAAGESKRMKSETTKVLHMVAGKPVLAHTLDAVRGAGIERILVVVGRQGEQVKERFSGYGAEFVHQEKPLGTGHAAYVAMKKCRDPSGTVLVVCGDVPLLLRETLLSFLLSHEEGGSILTVLTALLPDATGYGRIVRGEGGQIMKIVEEKDATEAERMIREINSGLMCFEAGFLAGVLEELMSQPREKEYYLTDTIEMARRAGRLVGGYRVEDPLEVQGINDRSELAGVEDIMRERIRSRHMKNGVTIVNPSTVLIDCDVVIGEDTVIYAGTIIEGATRVGKRCSLGPFSRIVDASLGENVMIEGWNLIKRSALGDGSRMRAYEQKSEEDK
jgi:bifunctional UDP-N-acetylglucosamine pyrophosphorylase/glucosamine-1-phosphate N-acetyltransferase